MGQSVFPAPTTAGAPFSRYTRLTTSGTWAHPDGYSEARRIRVLIYGGGGGGSGGCAVTSSGTSSTVTYSAGMGGSSGYIVYQDYVVSGDTSYTIGAGGIGGTTVTTSGGYVEGSFGNYGGDTTFGTLTASGGGSAVSGQQLSSITYNSVYGPAGGGNVAYWMDRRTDWNRSTWLSVGGVTYSAGLGYPAYIPTYIARGGSWKKYDNQSINIQMLGNNRGPLNVSYYSGGSHEVFSGDYEHFGLLAGPGWHSGQIAINSTVPNTGFTATATDLIGTGRFPGGQCGANRIVASGTLTANSGQTPSGFGGGGGGGGSAVVVGTGTATGGAGGNGAPGMIEIWY